jgi:hypothetical protein
MGPNRRAKERERAATKAAESAKRAEAERRAIAEAVGLIGPPFVQAPAAPKSARWGHLLRPAVSQRSPLASQPREGLGD